MYTAGSTPSREPPLPDPRLHQSDFDDDGVSESIFRPGKLYFSHLKKHVKSLIKAINTLKLYFFSQRARTQHEKLSVMVEDLCDSETKLAKLLEDYNVRGITDEVNDPEFI